MNAGGENKPPPFSAEQMESVKKVLQQITENPSLLQDPRYEFIRSFLGRVQANPETFPLDNDGKEDGKEEELEGVCYCPDDRSNKQSRHSAPCLELQPLQKRIKELEETLHPVGVLQCVPEIFRSIDDARADAADDYLDSLYEMAERLIQLARENSTSKANEKRFLEAALEHFMVWIGHNAENGSSVINHVACILLELGRYDDLFAFAKFYFGRQKFTKEQRQLAQSGKFFLAAEKACSEEDIFADFEEDLLQSREEEEVLTLLVFLFFMKIRMLNVRKQWKDSLHSVFLKTHAGKYIADVSLDLEDLICPSQYEKFVDSQLEKLMDVIHQRNQSILPAFVFPEPLIEENEEFIDAIYQLPRCPLEAMVLLRHCEESFRKTVGAREMLVKRFGERPRYHYAPFDYTADMVGFREDAAANERNGDTNGVAG